MFSRFCAGELVDKPEEPEYTNQEIINAFYYAAADLGRKSRWSLLYKAKLSLSKLAADRRGTYKGPPISKLPHLTDRERAAVQRRLPRRSAGELDLAAPPEDFESGQVLDSELERDLGLALQAQILEGLEYNRVLLEQVLDHLSRGNASEPGWERLLTRSSVSAWSALSRWSWEVSECSRPALPTCRSIRRIRASE